MNAQHTKRRRSSEAGVAMLIAIFVLLLIAVVGIALILNSGTETALAGNYRSATAVHYAALAGLEEARGRLLLKNPNYLNAFATVQPAGQVLYITNPTNGGNVLTDYPDNEYNKEFGLGALAAATVTPIPSVSTVAGIQGQLYRWVRINPVTKQSLNFNFDGTSSPPTTLVYYDGVHLTSTATSSQALEITAMAVLPNGSQKMAQYIVVPNILTPQPNYPFFQFPAALTLAGNTPQFTAPTSPDFSVQGNDQAVPPPPGPCNPSATPAAAVAYTTGSPSNFIQPSNPSGISAGLQNHYTNGSAPNPAISPVILSPNLTTVAGLNNLVQTITQNADVVVNGPATQSGSHNIMPSGMSATSPAIVVVNGDLTFSSWRNTGYGILLVTGKLTYDPDASWNGIILVIGEGTMQSSQGAYTKTQIQGAVFLARTLDASNNPLPLSSPLGSPTFDYSYSSTTGNNFGIQYSSCWVQAVQPITYKVLSFHEILQQ
jgi:hypothetical protein